MSKGQFIPELPCEKRVRGVCGPGWRNLNDQDINAAWGVAIVQSILDGVKSDLKEVASHLGVDRNMIHHAFQNLSNNGAFLRDRIHNDTPLKNGDKVAWGYYAGYAVGAVGPYRRADD